MDKEIAALTQALTHWLRPKLQASEPLRQLIFSVGAFLQAQAEQAAASKPEGEGSQPSAQAPSAPAVTAAATLPSPQLDALTQPAHQPLVETRVVEMRIGDTIQRIEVPGTPDDFEHLRQQKAAAAAEEARLAAAQELEGFEDVPERELRLIIRRSKLKAESCRLKIKLLAAAGDYEREYRLKGEMNHMIAQAKSLPHCFLWAFMPDKPTPAPEHLERIALCYDVHAIAAEHVIEALPLPLDELSKAMHQLAEVNSALRVALQDTWLTMPDRDQEDAHDWLKREGKARQIFIKRHMRIDDPADPARVPLLRQAIEEHGRQKVEKVTTEKEVTQLLNKLKYHARQIREQKGEASAHLGNITAAVNDLGPLGVPPTDTRILQQFTPDIVELFPDEQGGSERIAKTLRAAIERNEEQDDAAELGGRRWSQRVLQVREMLRGRRLVLIGGEARQQAKAKIAEAFELSEVEWVKLNEHSTGDPMRAPILQPETAMVLALIRWTGHLHAEEARNFAREAGKPCVHIKAGYNPEQLADAILTQASPAGLGEVHRN